MSAQHLVREYHGCTIRSTPTDRGTVCEHSRDKSGNIEATRVESDGWFHAVYRGESLIGEVHTLGEAIQVAKGKLTPVEDDGE